MKYNNLKDWFEQVNSCQYCEGKNCKTYYIFEHSTKQGEQGVKIYLTEDSLNFFYRNNLYSYYFDGSSCTSTYYTLNSELIIRCINCEVTNNAGKVSVTKFKLIVNSKLKLKKTYQSYRFILNGMDEYGMQIYYNKNKTTLWINKADFNEFHRNGIDYESLNHDELVNKFKLIETFS